MSRHAPDLHGDRYIRGTEAARELFVAIATRPVETCVFAYLDPEWRLLGLRHVVADEVSRIELPLREVVRDAIAFDAARVLMAHNHPGGDPTPSDADIRATRRIVRALDPLGVRLVDHLVLAGDTFSSLRAMDLL